MARSEIAPGNIAGQISLLAGETSSVLCISAKLGEQHQAEIIEITPFYIQPALFKILTRLLHHKVPNSVNSIEIVVLQHVREKVIHIRTIAAAQTPNR